MWGWMDFFEEFFLAAEIIDDFIADELKFFNWIFLK